MNPLDPSYVRELDGLESDRWHELMLQFDDASYYQTWAFGAVHSGDTRLSHVVLERHGRVVAIAQARIATIRGLPVGIAHISNGPMWKRKDGHTDIGDLRNMLRALHHEYVVNRGYFLSVVPNLIDSIGNAALRDVFNEEGFSHRASPAETVVLDLSPPLEEIRRNLGRSWRRTLQSGEKNGLGIIEGTDRTFCETALKIFRQLKERKRFYGGNQEEALEVHKRLPECLKLHFAVCTHAGEPIAVLGWVTFGSTGLPLVSATSGKALELDAAYVLWWRMIEYYKTHGFSSLDTGGVSKQRNPGGYYFKTHILGKGFKEPDRTLGQFDACGNPLSAGLFKAICTTRDGYREIGRRLARRRATGSTSTRPGPA